EAALPMRPEDRLFWVDATDEPTTEGVDSFAREARGLALPCAVVAVGGGCTLDSAKATANLLTNPGRAEDYQGWDLVKNPAPYKIGIPTLSGTGAEASRTCVMSNARKGLKLGMNSQHTVYDELILDPDLTATVPRDQYFHTGMDTYIHCVESLEGGFRHALADAWSRESLRLCREVFESDDMMSDDCREKLMAASFLGGSAIGNSLVGLLHPFSAGLSMVFHTHHCVGNCIALRALSEFYPNAAAAQEEFVRRQGVSIPEGLTKNADQATFEALYRSTIVHEKPLSNALGPEFKRILTPERVASIFGRM
ncbi:MAG TPA: iron-containing alcohol dehydrogenase family protein, partial [Fibrobacteria bacterium]|nr:iron-containing alcohol dehydrogenase family protein [Fibrobacteria bacterium]